MKKTFFPSNADQRQKLLSALESKTIEKGAIMPFGGQWSDIQTWPESTFRDAWKDIIKFP